MDDLSRAAERIMPWEFRQNRALERENELLREYDDTLFPGVGLWPYWGYYFPPYGMH